MTVYKSFCLKSLPGIARVSAIVLITVGAFAWAFYVRRRLPSAPLSLDDLARVRFANPYAAGVLIQSLVVPAALIFLFTGTPLFRRVVADQPGPRVDLKLFGALALIQLLAINYELGFFFPNPDRITLGLLVVVLAGLLGGWRVGLGIGILTMLIIGTRTAISEMHVLTHAPQVYRHDGLRGFFHWARDVGFFLYLANLRAGAPIWAGTTTGLIAELLGERRFTPPAGAAVGFLADLGAGALAIIAAEDPGWLTELLLSSATVSGLAVAVVTLMVRNVQAETIRRRAEAAELARAQAELRALRAQINPHFLFNALNTIRYFVRTDPGAARRLLLDLSTVFQRVLRSGEFVSLQDELEHVQAYLALERARLGERLRVEWDVRADPWLDQPVPTLILQPIVENAVIHGVGRQTEGGTVHVTVVATDSELLLQVQDDGPGIPAGRLVEVLGPERDGGDVASIGLRNVDGRLRALYGDVHLPVT